MFRDCNLDKIWPGIFAYSVSATVSRQSSSYHYTGAYELEAVHKLYYHSISFLELVIQ